MRRTRTEREDPHLAHEDRGGARERQKFLESPPAGLARPGCYRVAPRQAVELPSIDQQVSESRGQQPVARRLGRGEGFEELPQRADVVLRSGDEPPGKSESARLS